MSSRLGRALWKQDTEVMWSCLSPRQARQSPAQLIGMKKLSNHSFSHATGKKRVGKTVTVLHHSPHYPRMRRTGNLPGPFTLYFFMLYMQKRKRKNPVLGFWLPLGYCIMTIERHPLKTSTLAPTTLFCKGLHPVSRPPVPHARSHAHTSGIFLFLSLFSLVIRECSQSHVFLKSAETDWKPFTCILVKKVW